MRSDLCILSLELTVGPCIYPKEEDVEEVCEEGSSGVIKMWWAENSGGSKEGSVERMTGFPCYPKVRFTPLCFFFF